jgi:hypothetical protein
MREKRNIKRAVTCLAGLLLAFFVVTPSAVRAQSPYSGWITGYLTASQVAATGTSSIGMWMKKLNCDTEADCVQKLVGAGGKYVLVINNDVYQLSDQKLAAQHPGMAVMIKGVLNYQKKTVEVADMQMTGVCD